MPSPANQPDPFLQRVRETIDGHNLISPGATVLVAVSGGPDSIVLLDVLAKLAPEAVPPWRLVVAHLHHGLRDGADADAAFVADLADKHGLALAAERRNVAPLAQQTGQSIETAAREARYAFLAEQARGHSAACVAVGHHADDNVETVLYRIARGTHLRGLAGMPIRRALGQAQLIRPLLGCRRTDILDYVQRVGLAWCDDPSNRCRDHRRNIIRHDLLPHMRRELNGRVDEAILRLAQAAAEADQLIEALARRTLEKATVGSPSADECTLRVGPLAKQEPVVRAAAMRLALEAFDAGLQTVTAEHLQQLALLAASPPGPAVCLPGGIHACRSGNRIVLARRQAER